MTQYSDHAIILGFVDDRETDRLYTLLTRSHGKMTVRGSGARKSGAKLAPHLDRGMMTHVMIMRNRGRGTITYALSEDVFLDARFREDTLCAMRLILTITERLLPQEQREGAIFAALHVCLQTFSAIAHNHLPPTATALVRDGYLFHMLAHLGWHMTTHVCVRCGAPLVRAETYTVSLADGGFLCHDCSKVILQKKMIISRDAAAALHLFAHNTIPSLIKVRVSHSVAQEVHRIMQRRIAWITS